MGNTTSHGMPIARGDLNVKKSTSPPTGPALGTRDFRLARRPQVSGKGLDINAMGLSAIRFGLVGGPRLAETAQAMGLELFVAKHFSSVNEQHQGNHILQVRGATPLEGWMSLAPFLFQRPFPINYKLVYPIGPACRNLKLLPPSSPQGVQDFVRQQARDSYSLQFF